MDQTKIEFEVEYSMSSSRFWRVGKGFIYFFAAVVGCWWLWSVGQYQRRNHAVDSANMPSGGLTLGYLFNILLLLGRLFVHVFFPLCFCLCSYWFVFFKMQSTAYALLPTENRHDGKDFEYWGADAASFIKTFPTFTSFPRRRADPDHLALGDPNVGGLPARLQAVHHGGALRGLGAGSGPGPAEPFSY